MESEGVPTHGLTERCFPRHRNFSGATMKRSRPHKTLELVHQKLTSYALAAGAAGVSSLALSQPAAAKIVYTPAHVNIVGPHAFYQLDLNHDGIVDFSIANTVQITTDQFFWDVVL